MALDRLLDDNMILELNLRLLSVRERINQRKSPPVLLHLVAEAAGDVHRAR